MSVSADIEQAVVTAELSLTKVEGYAAAMRGDLARCDWTRAAVHASCAAAAFEAHLDAIQAMYRTMARS